MKATYIVMFLFLLISCGPSNERGEVAMLADSGVDRESMISGKRALEPPSSQIQESPVQEKKVVKNGNLGFQVDDLQAAYDSINQTISKYEAYIENESQSTYGDRSQYSMTIRVVSESFDKLMLELTQSSKFIENKSINVRDVTGQYYDLETRLKNKKALEARYIDLLKKTSSIKDILDIEKNLNEIRTEIEMLQGQFDYLSKQVSYSIIQLNFYEILPYRYKPESRPGFAERILISLSGGWRLFISFLIGIVKLWPFIIVITAGTIVIVRRRRRKTDKS